MSLCLGLCNVITSVPTIVNVLFSSVCEKTLLLFLGTHSAMHHSDDADEFRTESVCGLVVVKYLPSTCYIIGLYREYAIAIQDEVGDSNGGNV